MMNIRVIQPPYPKCAEETPDSVAFMVDQLRHCDESLDLILLPECCNAPSGCGNSALLRGLVAEHTETLLNAVKETAIRCKATVGINLYVYGQGYETTVRNATQLYDSRGNLVAQYDKQHLPASEFGNEAIDHSYLANSGNPFCAEIDGVRYAFLTCYDMYYTEFIHRISLERPDVVLICSLQRAERPDILEMQGKNCAFVCNSYVVRSSYHMGSDAKTGGCSMIVAPDGMVLQNFGQGKGSFDCKVDNIRWKYRRSNGFGQPEVTNDVYQTLYRTPWCYRAGGSGVRPTDEHMAFPRICARGGCPQTAPENTLPSVGAAVALGAAEVALDIRDDHGIPVLGTGSSPDIGKVFPHLAGLGYPTLEEIFAAFPRRTVFQLRLGSLQDPGALIQRIRELANRYDCPQHFYIASENPGVLAAAALAAPDTSRCLIGFSDDLLAAAYSLGCSRIQTDAAHLTDDVLRNAARLGIRCNLVALDDPAEAEAWLNKGVDCVLTDRYWTVSHGTGKH